MREILLTGGTSMIGRAILEQKECDINWFEKEEFDLTRESDAYDIFDAVRPKKVIHLAGYNGGLPLNLSKPSTIFARSVQMGINVLTMCQEFKVERVVSVISSCAYPDMGDGILHEDTLWDGKCNPTVECHGNAKRTLDCYSRFLRKEFALNAVTCVLPNCFGPGDRFSQERSKAIAAIIRKIVEAKNSNADSVTFFGTGTPTREFLYCKDAANAILRLVNDTKYYSTPLNIGFEQEYSIKEIVEILVDILDFRGTIKWDTSKPDGQMRKTLESSRFQKTYWELYPREFKDALKETVDWYIENKEEADER